MSKLILSVLFTFLLGSLNAQHVREYRDEFGKKGEIRTTKPFEDTLLPRDGRFELRWRSVDSTAIHTYHAVGQTRQHNPQGKWRWEEATWKYAIVPGNSIRPAFETNGIRTQWNGEFQLGVPHGKWSITRDSIDGNGQSGTQMLHMEMTYNNGIPTGTYIIERRINGVHFHLKGTLSKMGLAHGSWHIDYASHGHEITKETRTYHNGLLLEVRTTTGEHTTVKTFAPNQAFVQGKPVNHSRIGSLHFEQDEWGQFAGEEITELTNLFIGSGWTHEAFSFDFIRRKPAYVQLEFPLSEEELTHKQASIEKLAQIQQELNLRLEDNMLIHRTRGPEYDLAVSYLEFTKFRTTIIDSLLKRTDSPLFTYKNRHERGLLHWCSAIDGVLEVNGTVYPDKQAELPAMGKVTDESTIFHLLHALLQRTAIAMQPYLERLDEARTALQREGELQLLQDKLVSRYEQLVESYRQSTGIANMIELKWVNGESKQLLQEFARTDRYEEALVLGETLLKRMDVLQNWRIQADRVDSMPSLLHAQYRYLAYNPYTGVNDIEVKLKRRFLHTIQTIYWPWLESQLIDSADWTSLVQNWRNTFNSFNFLMNFAVREDKAADRLQKRIRKEKKPERIWKLIQPFLEEEHMQSLKR
jgi:hypothetical protein